MAKRHAFCNDICNAVNITHTNCNYWKILKTRRLLNQYTKFSVYSSNKTHIKYLCKLYELKTGKATQNLTPEVRETIKEAYGGYKEFLICSLLRLHLSCLNGAPATTQIPTARQPPATPVSPHDVDTPAIRQSPRLLASAQSSPENIIPTTRTGYWDKFVADFNAAKTKKKENYKNIKSVEKNFLITRK